MEMLTVGVIVPTYNRSALLAESLKSIARQTRPADFVVVVDDGSTDDTDAVVQEVQREFFPDLVWPYFRYIRRESNGGKAAAVNTAIADFAKTDEPDLVWIFDDDDIADTERLEILVPFFDEDPKLDVVHTSAEFRENLEVDVDGQVVGNEGGRTYWSVQDAPDTWSVRWFLHGCRWFGISVMFRRNILDRLYAVEGEFATAGWPMDTDLERAQDYDLWIRFLAAGATSKGVDRTTVYARTHPGDRGIGHRLKTPEQVDQKTADAERIIFAKVRDRIRIRTIFPGYDGDPVLRQEAAVEMGYAFAIRDMDADAVIWLERVDLPRMVRYVHRTAMSYLIEKYSTGPVRQEAIRIRDAWDEANADASDDPGLTAAAAW